jgi:phosphatidylglycerol:prolipoprotein diacylglycerol transferase
MAIVAFFLSTIVVVLLSKSRKISVFDAISLSFVATFCGILTAKLQHLAGCVINGEAIWTAQFWKDRSITAGFVWYGGVLGALLSVVIYARIRKILLKRATDLMVPFALTFDGIARFGCLFAGCCYGKESTWGFDYNGTIRLPWPLFESVLCFIILVQFLVWKPERKHPGILLPLYLLTYSFGRFILEYFRGDDSRGFFLFFSTSQWIALLIVTIMILFIIRVIKPQRRDNFGVKGL